MSNIPKDRVIFTKHRRINNTVYDKITFKKKSFKNSFRMNKIYLIAIELCIPLNLQSRIRLYSASD